MSNEVSVGTWHSRGYLPHFEQEGAVQSVTFRFADSLPNGCGKAADPRKIVNEELDRGRGACLLSIPAIAELMVEILLHFDGVRYRLLAWVIMPNHVHAILEPLPGWTLSKILQGWKGYSAHEINSRLDRRGQVWESESYNRVIRDENHFWRAIQYIHWNPVKAGLATEPEDFPWSSAILWKLRQEQ